MKHTKFIIVLIILLTASLTTACKMQKNPDEMSDEEKIQYRVPGENNLSDEEMQKQHEARAAIIDRMNKGNKAEEAIQNAINDAENILGDDDFFLLQQAQKQWELQGRGKDMNQLLQTGIDTKDAYALASAMRADKIREQTTHAILINSSNGFQGYFKNTLQQSLEIFVIGKDTVTATIRSSNPEFVIAVHGSMNTMEDNAIILVSNNDPSVSVQIQMTDPDTIELTPTPDFAASRLAPFAAAITTQFKRIKKGDINVFSI